MHSPLLVAVLCAVLVSLATAEWSCSADTPMPITLRDVGSRLLGVVRGQKYEMQTSAAGKHCWRSVLHDDCPVMYPEYRYKESKTSSFLLFGIECKGCFCNDIAGFAMRYMPHVPHPLMPHSSYRTMWTVSGSNEPVRCPPWHFATAIDCADPFCSSLRLRCSPLMAQYRPLYEKNRFKKGTMDIWEGMRGYCPEGRYIDGIACTMGTCRHPRLYCSEVQRYTEL